MVQPGFCKSFGIASRKRIEYVEDGANGGHQPSTRLWLRTAREIGGTGNNELRQRRLGCSPEVDP
jgi:hypothetical protein